MENCSWGDIIAAVYQWFTPNYKDIALYPCILFADVWQQINNDPVCFGARDDQYGAFNVTKTGRVKAMKLVHRYGSIKCHLKHPLHSGAAAMKISMQTICLWQTSQMPTEKLFCLRWKIWRQPPVLKSITMRERERQFIHNKNVAASRLNCVIVYKE